MSVQGSLEDMGIIEILQMPLRERKTGVLEIVSDNKQAQLVYQNGVLVNGKLDDLTGEEVVYELIGWSVGEFSLVFKDVESDVNISSKVENLILEGVRRQDEKQKQIKDIGIKNDQLEQIKYLIKDVVSENENIIFSGITDKEYSKLISKHEKEEIPMALKQNIAIMLQLIRESAKHVEDDQLEVFNTQSKSFINFSQRLENGMFLLVACEQNVPLGELLLIVRTAVDGIDEILN